MLVIAMSEVTQILQQVDAGDPSAAEELLPLVYDELRRLAARNMARESPDHTLQPTALVHEAYLRLVGGPQAEHWNSRGHFFAAAAEAMRRILVENARRKQRLKHGGELLRVESSELTEQAARGDNLVLSVDESLASLAEQNAQAAQLVKLRFFGGLTLPEAAAALNISPRTADRLWAYAKAWLHQELEG
jgi:RNA polymerase sigma factor (TIGR02999 family)